MLGLRVAYRAHPLERQGVHPDWAIRGCVWAAGWWLGMALAAMPVLAQPVGRVAAPADATDVLEGRPIRRVVFRLLVSGDGKAGEGFPEDLERLIRNNIRTREGSAYARDLVSGDLEILRALGRFEQIEQRVEPLEDGTINLVYLVLPQPIIKDVQSVGNRVVADEDIQKQVSVLIGTPANPATIKNYADSIERVYRSKGYFGVKVGVDREALRQTGTLVFVVREGQRTRVTDVRFEGNVSYRAFELRREIKTTEVSLLDKGLLDESQLDVDVAALVQYYKDRGYLNVRVDRSIRPSPNGREAIVTFLISEGPVFTLRSVRAEYDQGAPVLSPEQLVGLMAIKPGEVYGVTSLQKSVQAIREAYGQMGYMKPEAGVYDRDSFCEIDVTPQEERITERSQVDLVLRIRQGRRFRTGEVIVRGNTSTRQEVIRRQVRVEPDRPLDTTALRETRLRLQQTRLFAEGSVRVTPQPASDEEPDVRDVLVEVDETNTGSIQFGGTVSSDGGVGFRFVMSQRNFDVTDTPETFEELITGQAFRGAGQTFNLELLPGDRIQTFSVGVSEPALFESDYSGSASVYARRRVYRQYDEIRYGTKLSLGRRFGSRWSGSIPLRLESVNLNNIDAGAPVDYFLVEETKVVTSAGLSMQRTTLDRAIRPTKGSMIELSAEQVGALGGDFNFTSLRGEHRLYVPVLEDVLGRRTVLFLNAKAGYIPRRQEAIPTFDRFYLGGQSFRGFGVRGVSPRGVRADTGELGVDPVGGRFMFFYGAEVQQPLYEETIAGVLFVDSGTVDSTVSFENYRVSVGFGVRITIPGLSPVPLAFDFGFPIVKAEGDDERLFTFSIDLPFNR